MSLFRIVEHTIRCQHSRDRIAGAELGRENDLRLHVKQYIPKDNPEPRPGDVTIIGAVANAYPKEIHEPLWDEFYSAMQAKGRRIRGIWVADPVNTGQSGVINEELLGPDPSWWDHGRDLLFLINQFQDEIPHPIVGIGHSMGASHLAYMSFLHPRLLDALVLVDPVMQRGGAGKDWAAASTYRRDLWPSRKEAAEKLRASKGLKAWDRRCLEKYIEFGLRELPTELHPELPEGQDVPVTLQTTKGQEQVNYIRPVYHDDRMLLKDEDRFRDFHAEDAPVNESFGRHEKTTLHRRLPELRPSTLYVFGAKSEVSTPDQRDDKLSITGGGVGGSGGAARGRVQGAVIDCGHLVTLEKPQEAAEVCATFVDSELGRWESEEAERRKLWEKLSRKERVDINDLWRQNVGPPPGRAAKKDPSNPKL